ncbi:MAG: DNA methyltransferase, partial [Hydrogenophaga sp.]|uniref:DNA methyltransferase n=1 Tax=Hydrogenophaga sp. TaxID=1904254 RepID=UPI003D9AD909
MTPQAFIAKWGPGGPACNLNEEQGAQSHFIDLCDLLGVPRPGTEPGYLFEQGGQVTGQRRGYADVYKRGAFAWENKAPGVNLDTALRQLLGYTLALDNPPLLVVCDRLHIRIHTQFNGHPSERHDIALADLEQHDRRELLKRVWTAPESFRPRTTNRDITEAAAKSFATLAERLRQRGNGQENTPDAVAHFLTQCLFCCFAEDVGLLPGKLFDRLINAKTMAPERLGQNLGNLFGAMKDGGLFGVDDVPWFNGGLFQTIAVPVLDAMDVTELRNAAAKNWSAIDVSIFGTLFERGLDPSKRSQLGAHYTDPATIERIIDPVIRRPLLREWAGVKDQMAALLAKSKKAGDKAWRDALALHVGFLQRLAAYRVLDPACGSGNFLYLALKCLKDVEHLVNTEAEALGLDRQVELATGPANVLGIELNEYAAELARVTVWIGELQWRLDHGYPFKTNPVLEPLDHIEHRDALLCCADGVGGGAGGPDGDGSRVPKDPEVAAPAQPA